MSNKQPVDKLKETPKSPNVTGTGRAVVSSAAGAAGSGLGGVLGLGSTLGTTLLTTAITSAIVSYGVTSITGGSGGGPIGPDLSLTGILGVDGLASLNGGVDTTTISADTINVTTLNLSGPISLSSVSDLTVTNSLTVDTNTLIVEPITNRVGVGSAVPTEKLDVVGNIKATGTVSATGLSGTLTTPAQTNITSVGTLSTLTVSGDLTVDTNVLKVNSTTNHVGVNNSAPSEALDVTGNIKASGSILGTLGTGAQPNITSTGTLSSLNVSGDLSVDTNVLKVDSANNRVGVNNSAPTEALDVTGNIKSSGSITGSTLTGTLTSGPQPNITSLGALSSLTVTGDLTVDTNTLKVDSTNNRVGVNNSTPSEALDVVGNIKASGTIAGTLSTSAQPNITSTGTLSSLTVSGDLTVDANTLKVDSTNNRVGVNNTLPAEALDVTGNIKSSGSVTGSTLSGTISTAAQPNITSLGTLSSLTVSGNLNVDSDTLKVDSALNHVGINNASPTEALDVTGNIKSSGTITGTNLAGTLTTAAQGNVTSLGTLSSLTVSGDITVDTNTLKVDSTNNHVGINNSLPAEALDVTGNIKASGSVTGSTLSGTISTPAQPNITSLGTLSSLTVSGNLNVDSDTLKVDSALNHVGINNASPIEALDVTGNIKSSGTITGTNLAGTLTTAAQGNVTSLGTLTALTVTGDLTVDTNTLKVDSTNNRVGVNNATPSEALDVVGNVQVSGTIAGTLATAAQTNITSVGTLSSLVVSGDLTVDTNTLKVDSLNNHVGINNSLPTEALDVTGNIKSSGTITGTNLAGTLTTASQPNITSTGTLSSLTVSGDLTVDANTLKVDSTNNRVGVNNATPSEALDVSGNVKVSGTISADDIVSQGSTMNIAGTTTGTVNLACGTVSQIVNIGTTANGTTINIGGAGDTVNIGGALNYINTTDLNVTNKQIYVNVGGAAGSGGGAGLYVEEGGNNDIGYLKVKGTRDGWLLKGPAGVEGEILTTSGPHFVTNGSNIYYTTGSVGIGSTTPTVALDVVGNIRATGTVTATGGLEGSFTALNITGDLTVNTDVLRVDTINDRVGINTLNPTYDLDVTGDANVSGTIYGTLGTAAQATITSVGTLAGLTVSGDVVVDTDVFKVDVTNDRVGINTSAPAYDLDVVGDANVSGTIYGTLGTASQSSITSVGTLTSLDISGDLSVDTDVLKVVSSNNRVGINSSTPAEALDVTGNIKSSGTITGTQLSGSITTAAQTNITSVGTLTSLDISGDLSVDTNVLLVDSLNNKVGINSSTPAEALDVTGNIKSSGTITGTNLAGTLTTAAQTSITSVGTLTSLDISGDLSVDMNVLKVVSSNNRVGINSSTPSEALDVVGNITSTGTITGTQLSGSITTASQTSITSVGTLTSLDISGDLSVDTNVLKVDSTNNRVGVNNSTPLEALDVTGNIKSSGTITGTSLAGELTTAAQPNVTSLGTLTTLTVNGDIAIDTNVLKVDSSNNRVGINSTSPGYALDVVGDASVSGSIYGTLGTAAQTNITSVGTLSNLTISGDLTVDTDTLKVDSTNNRVGINNLSPVQALDVVGNIASTGTISGSTVSATTLTGTLSTAAQGNITSLGTLTGLTVSGTTALNGGLTMDADKFTVADSTGDVTTAGTLTVTGITSLNGGLVMDGDRFTVADTTGNVVTAGTLSVAGDVTVDTSAFKVVTSTNQVGINTSAPGYTLDVDGAINARIGHTYKIDGTDVLSATSLGSGVTGSSLTSVGTLSSLTVSGDLTVDTNTLYVDSVDNRIGVKTTDPNYPLDVDGAINVRVGHTYKVNGTDVLSATTLGSGVLNSSLTSVGTLSSLTVSGDLIVDTSSLVVDSVNNLVGVNTILPGYTLDVDGPINARTGHTYKVNGTDVLSATTLGSGVVNSSLTSVGTLSSLTVSGATALNGGLTMDTDKFTVADTTGDVATSGTLTVTGLTSLNGGLVMDDKFTVADTTGNVTTAGTLTVAGDVAVDTNVFVVNTSTNRVGINSAAPTQALDVVGSIKTSSKVLVDTIESIGATMNIGNSTDTTTLNLACGTNTQVVNIGTNSGATTINIGGSGDTVNIAGTLTYVQTTNLEVSDKAVILNKGGAAASGGGAGIFVEEGGVEEAYIKIAPDRASWLLKKPTSSNVETILTDYGPHFVSSDADIVFSTGNVGIGTNAVSGAYVLEVVGDTSISGDMTVDTDTLFVDSSNNNVGIGTTTPNVAFKLDVNGATNSGGNFSVNTMMMTVASSTGNTYIAGTLEVDGTTTILDSQFTKAPEIITIPVNEWVDTGVIEGEAPVESKFGTYLDLTSDGLGLVVGAPYNNDSAFNAGSARVYTRESASASWIKRGGDIDGDGALDSYGLSVAINSDTTVVAVGAGGSGGGYGRVFAWDGSSWIQRGPDFVGSAGSGFKSVSLDASGSTFAFTTPSAVVYTWSGSSWSQKGSVLSNGGGVVSISADGDTVLTSNGNIGADGVVSVFSWNGSSWIQKGTTISGDPGSSSFFGWTAKLSADGNSLIGGSLLSGYTGVYLWDGISWVQRGGYIPGSAYQVSISSDANLVIIASFNSTKIYEWNPIGSTWDQKGVTISSSKDDFVTGLGMNATGSLIAVGDPSNNRVKTFEYIVDRFINFSASRLQLEDNSRITVLDDASTSENLNGDILFETRPVNTDPWTERMRIHGSGGVDIDGNLNLLSSSVLKIDDVTILSETALGSSVTSSSLTSVGTLSGLTVSGSTALDGGLTMDTDKFTVADTTGNVATAGTLTVTGLTTLNGGLTMDSGAFAVADSTGDVTTGGTIKSTKTLAPTTPWASLTQANSKILLYDNTGNNWSGMGVDDGGHFWLRTGVSSQNLFVMQSDGKIGIGTTNPSGTFHVYDPVRAGSSSGKAFYFGDGTYGFSFENGTNTGYAPVIKGQAYDTNDDGLFIIGSVSSVSSTANGIRLDGRIPGGAMGAGNLLSVSNYAVDKFVIDYDGKVGIGSTTPAAKLDVSGSGSISYSSFWVVDNTSANSTTDEFASVGGPTPYDTSIRASNYVSAAAYVVTSDKRIKKNISEINDGDALEKLRKVEPSKYEYVDKATRHNGEVYGFIAQQVKEHFPEAVSIGKDFVPDVYLMKSIDVTTNVIVMGEKAKAGKLRLITKTRIMEPMVELLDETTVKITDLSIVIDRSEISEDDNIFVYGYEVNDFHRLNKDYLFTINFAATQELDRQNTQLKSRVQELESQLEAITNALSAKGIL